MQNKPQKSNENNFMTILNFIVDPAVVVDEKGRFLAINNAFEELTGLSEKELIGTAFLDVRVLTAESKAILLKNLMKRMKGLPVEPYEISFTDKTGQTRYTEVKAKKIDYVGRTADIVIFRDITRRKENARRLKEYSEKMEALVEEKAREIKEQKEKLETIFNSSPDAITVADLNGIIVECNEATLRLHGFSSKDELVGKNTFKLLSPKELHRASVLMKTIWKNGSVKNVEFAFLTKDGKEFLVEASASVIKNAAGNPIGLVAIAKDITERKKMEDELKHERDMLESVTENVGAGLAIISKDYHILWANKLLEQLNGDCEGKLCYSTFNRLTEICPDCGVKKVFDKGVPIDIHEYITKDDKGNTVWVELIVTPIKDEKGNVIAALELAVNITERKIMQNKLTEYSQKLEKIVEKRTEQLKQTQAKLVKSERLATIGELAAMVGHDLRNPLTGIMGAAYYLKTKHGTEVGAKGKEMLETIEKAINYSNKIINDLLEYSRDLKLELTATTPKAMLQSALPLLEVQEKIQIIDATKDKPTVKADTEKIRKGFVNIIQNAIDAMPEGGTLTIKNRKVKGKLEIAFKDTGTGMSEEALSKLEGGVPLFTTKAKGMGFGLPICRRIVEAHGGKLSVKSTAGKGTTVTVTIPVNPEPADEGEEKWIFSESVLSAITAAQRAP
jgi:two-component system sporulation sensor kinase A